MLYLVVGLGSIAVCVVGIYRKSAPVEISSRYEAIKAICAIK